MKRILAITSLIILFGSLPLQAAPVSISKAMDIASKVFAAQSTRKAANSALKMIWDGEDIATKATQPAFYVIARDGGGFVIVAGDDNVTPILAISDRSEFKVEGMPENVKWWMERMKAYVRATTGQAPEVGEAWAAFTTTKAGLIPSGVTVTNEILTPEWGQGAVYREHNIYNSKCPVVGGTNTLTGCVATAISEVMTTLSGIYTSAMPASGSGTIEPYSLPSGFDPAVYTTAATEGHPYVLGATYDWVNLRTLTGPAAIMQVVDEGNTALIENMNQLLADVGAVVHAFYSINDTGAYTEQIPDPIAKYFGFNKAAYYDAAANYSAHQWREKLKEQLAVRPIFYRGGTEKGNSGHAFVFDGYGTYQGADVFHVNFGWDGWCNGYYYETNLDAAGPDYNFSWKCGAVFDFYPDPSSKPSLSLRFSNYVYNGLVFEDPFSVSDWFRILLSVKNVGTTTYNGKYAVKLIDRSGNEKSDFEINTDTDYGWTDELTGLCIGFMMPDELYIKLRDNSVDIEFGDRIILYCTTDEDKTVFEPVKYLMDGSVLNELPLVPLAFIRTEDSYKVGDWFEFALMNHDQIYAGTRWTFTDPDGKAVTIDQSEWEFQLTKKGIWMIEAAVASEVGADPIKSITTYISVR